MLTEALKRGYV